MEKLQINQNFRIVKIDIKANASMKRHIATSDACLLVEEGSALLIYSGETYELNKGETFVIPANEQHMLRVINDLKAWIVLANGAEIRYAGPDGVYN